MKPHLILVLATVLISQPTATQAANIYVAGMRWTGIPAIWIDGQIAPGDDRKFAAVARRSQASVVYLTSPGGDIEAAIEIGRMVRKLGLDTFVGRGGIHCASACPLIWLAGRHAIVQRDSNLCFHAANVPEGTEMMVEYLAELGLKPAQINYILRTPQPDIQCGTEREAIALGTELVGMPAAPQEVMRYFDRRFRLIGWQGLVGQCRRQSDARPAAPSWCRQRCRPYR